MNPVLSKIIELINSDNFYKAELEIRKIYPDNPQSFDLNKMLGLCLLAQRKYNSALKCFERCFSIKKDDYDVVLNLSFIFTKIQFYEEAINYSKEAIKLNPQRPQAYQNISTSYFFLGKFEEAKKYAEESIQLRGGMDALNFLDTEDLVVLYADILIAQGQKNDFVSYAKKILKKKYLQKILTRLHRENPANIENEHIELTESVIQSSFNIQKKVERNTRLSDAYFFLAEYQSKKNKNLSEEYYIKANKLINDMQRESLFLRQKYARTICNFFRSFEIQKITNEIDSEKGKGLIFVLGMPRSGTTLTESILSTSRDLITGGEKSFFSLQLFETITSENQNELNLDSSFFNDLGDRYLKSIELHRDGKSLFVDKLPENYLFYKYIKLSLPGAKFIHCFRDPWDNAISLFKQNYSINIFYASSFFGIATEYANYEFLVKYWKQMDGDDALFDVEYEKLVKDNSLINKLWKYCDLKGEYSEEKRKEHFGFTASMQQVTKDIYSSSLKKDDFIDFKEDFFSNLQAQREYWQEKFSN